MPRNQSTSRFLSIRGFTLVELMVAIVVVAVLAFIMLSATRQFMEKSRSVSCHTHLRNLGVAVFSYAADNDTDLPRYYTIVDRAWKAPFWFDYLTLYLPNLYDTKATTEQNRNASFYCPAEKTHCAWTDYGANGFLFTPLNSAAPDRAIKLNKLTQPSQTIVLMDSRHRNGTEGAWYISLTAFANDPKNTSGTPLSGVPYPPRHGNHVNILFADGHSESMPFETLQERRHEFTRITGL